LEAENQYAIDRAKHEIKQSLTEGSIMSLASSGRYIV
jgi:hypothetical protein